MTISQRIFALLREKKLSQKELSEYTGISPAAISSWKSKGTNPSSDKIVKISEFLDVDVYYLLTGEYQPASNLQIAEESEYHAFPSDPDEHLLLQLFHKLSPMDKGRIIGQLEQKLAEKKFYIFLYAMIYFYSNMNQAFITHL